MAEIDSAQEWRRLQELYAGMSVDELEAVADDGYELTDIAKQALNAEISRRSLKIMVRPAPPSKQMEIPTGPSDDLAAVDLDLRVVIDVDNRAQAEWVKTKLNQGGVLCRFGPRVVEDVDRLRFSGGSPIGVRVLHEDLKRAQYLLQDFAAHFGKKEEAEEELDYSVRCPKCHSAEIVFQGFNDDSLEEQLETEDNDEAQHSAHEPTRPEPDYCWTCDACGHQWNEDGVQSDS